MRESATRERAVPSGTDSHPNPHKTFIPPRFPVRMNRRSLLASLGAGTVALSGCTALGYRPDDTGPGYYRAEPVAYNRADLSLSLSNDAVSLGDTIELETRNTGESKISLGCKNPWAIQYHTDGEWEHVTWTSNRVFQMCATILFPGGSHTQSFTLSESALAETASEVQLPLAEGTYRILLIGTSPYLARNFDIVTD